MQDEDFFFKSDINEETLKPREYSFKRPWGIPVRYHDFKEYQSKVTPNFFEFHLSYSDMEIDPKDFIEESPGTGFVVHAPELFSNSRLMDLATESESYRTESIVETQKVIDITRNLKEYLI